MIFRIASGGPADVSRAKLLKKFDQNFLLSKMISMGDVIFKFTK